MESFKLLSIGLIAIILISACSEQKASEEVLKVIDTNVNNEQEAETKSLEEVEEITRKEVFKIEAYTVARFNELKGNTPVVINFHATWCPVCRELDKKLADSIIQLPPGAVMLKADFDDEQDLKKELGITQQTTLVFFNKDGEETSRKYNPSIEVISKLLSS